MKICVIGAPSTGKSIFARSLSAEMSKRGHNCELVQEYASQYIQLVGAPQEAWEQLVISIGQHMSEQRTKRSHMITDAAAFATYVYAQRFIPERSSPDVWPKHQHLLDLLRTLARQSVESYDLILLLTHVFPPQQDGVRLENHLSLEECQDINRDLAAYLKSERISHLPIDASQPDSLAEALAAVEARLGQHNPILTPALES